jgi:single-stranded DNA-binding protein
MTIECAFIGVLGRDAEVKNFSRGKPYLKLNLRVAEGDDAEWISTVSFDPEALLRAERYVKGVKVYIEGRISLNEWTGQDGAKRVGLACMANYSRLVAIGRNRFRDGRSVAPPHGRKPAARGYPPVGTGQHVSVDLTH